MKGIIYKIKCNITNEQYIGSTVKSIKDRMRIHTQRKNCSSRQILNRGNYEVTILQTIECDQLTDLRKLEREYFNTNECINTNRPYRTDEEKVEDCQKTSKKYNTDNKEKVKAYNKKYREDNRAKLNELDRIRNAERKEYSSEYHKKYYLDHK